MADDRSEDRLDVVHVLHPNVREDGSPAAAVLRTAATLAGVALIAAACAPASGTVVVDPTVEYQTIRGWEVSAEVGAERLVSSELRDSVVSLAANVLGINRVRVTVRSGSELPRDYFSLYRSGEISYEEWECWRFPTENDNADPRDLNPDGFTWSEVDETIEWVVLPLRDRLARAGKALHVNVNYVAFTGQMCGDAEYIHSRQPEEYAEFVLALFLHLRDTYDLVPDTWEMVLEPDLSQAWTGRQIGEALVATERRLSAEGFHPRFAAPSTTNLSNAVDFFEGLAEVEGAADLLDELPYHRYSPVTRDAELRWVARTAAEYGLETAMLEKMGAGVDELHDDLTTARVSSWQQFALAYPVADDGAQLVTYRVEDGRAQDIRIASDARLLSQYFRFVPAGSVRIGATSPHRLLRSVAFRRPDGSHVVVVHARVKASIRVRGLRSGPYRATYTNDDVLQERIDVFEAADGTRTLVVPGPGVVTLESGPAAPSP